MRVIRSALWPLLMCSPVLASDGRAAARYERGQRAELSVLPAGARGRSGARQRQAGAEEERHMPRRRSPSAASQSAGGGVSADRRPDADEGPRCRASTERRRFYTAHGKQRAEGAEGGARRVLARQRRRSGWVGGTAGAARARQPARNKMAEGMEKRRRAETQGRACEARARRAARSACFGGKS